ncbi:unnamed protein product [Ostreobium quekettii]|uniref:PSI-G n=1 Tax=Ostreobium quekettii TaxID=121088 RepID=A0A8S1JDJ2_9CHLO|nr:unnamed protein product [Ostreobium quekettii]|eukprot:evm.model.scf_528EXC.4 EVM.evm.TU.scf_528EXC.4   scf_528EXC:64681-65097(-)
MATTMSLKTPVGLRSSSALASRVNARVSGVRACPRATRQVTRAFSTQLIMSASTFTCLALGRWGFLDFQRKSVEKAGLPVQNGVSHADAGDGLAQEASFLLATNDPKGFNVVDVLMWGSVGHILGFIILATNASLRVG